MASSPFRDSDEVAWEEAKASAEAWEKRNYKSFIDNKEDSEEEMKRLADLGYIKMISKKRPSAALRSRWFRNWG